MQFHATRRVLATAAVGLIGSGMFMVTGLATAAHASGAYGDFAAPGSAASLFLDAPIVGINATTITSVTNDGTHAGTKDEPLLAVPANTTVAAKALDATVTVGSDYNSTSAEASTASVSLAAAGLVAKGVVASADWTSAHGGSGSTTIAYLQIGSTKLVNYQPPANDVISLGPLGQIVLNEQIPDGLGGVLVNAIHVELNIVGVNLIVSSASVGYATNSPVNCNGLLHCIQLGLPQGTPNPVDTLCQTPSPLAGVVQLCGRPFQNT